MSIVKHARAALVAAAVLGVIGLSGTAAQAAQTTQPSGTIQPSTTAGSPAGSATPLQPTGYAADGTPIYHITNRTVQPLATSHACAVGNQTTGTDSAHQGVFCADLVASANSNGTVTIYPQAEGVCQTLPAGASVQCANVTLNFGMWDSTEQELIHGSATCGHAAGPCPTPRYVTPPPPVDFVLTSGCINVWTVVYSESAIELPASDVYAVLGANVSSGHQELCAS